MSADVLSDAAIAAIVASSGACISHESLMAQEIQRARAAAVVLTCAFCGEAYPPGTPPTQHEALTAHVKVCEKHPLQHTIVDFASALNDVLRFCQHPPACNSRRRVKDQCSCGLDRIRRRAMRLLEERDRAD